LLIIIIVANNAHHLTNRHSRHCTEVTESVFLDAFHLKPRTTRPMLVNAVIQHHQIISFLDTMPLPSQNRPILGSFCTAL